MFFKTAEKHPDYESDAEEENEAASQTKENSSQQSAAEVDLQAVVKLEVKMGQTPIVAQESSQLQTLLVKLNENTLDEEKISRTGLDLVCVIDCSGSMEGFKMQQV